MTAKAACRDELSRESLARNGWDNRSAVIVPDPELEIWIWSDSPNVDMILGWKDRHPGLRNWLGKNGFTEEGQAKPQRPKEAVESALKIVKKARSSSLYFQIAREVSFAVMTRRFLKLKKTLKKMVFGTDIGPILKTPAQIRSIGCRRNGHRITHVNYKIRRPS
ncbi:hypothetical protein QUF72_01430 [Desulfobacterales bacterium HSG2]|nr:hypothetical protein [Desulfobacterales bacterium HSG2]